MRSRQKIRILAFALLGCTAICAQAGRPLATDDAGTTEQGSCQVEAWVEGAGSDRAYVIAPACGVTDGLELGADVTRSQSMNGVAVHAGLALKWVPAAGALDTGLGKLNFGLKIGLGATRTAGANWRLASKGALALASLELASSVKVHFNVGPQRDHEANQTSTVLNAVVEWAPTPAGLLFAEALANDRRALNGGTVRSVGARWWLEPDEIGLDLTASRVAGAGNRTLWSIGFGWYGLGK